MASFAQKLAADNQRRNIYLVTGGKDHTGRPAWYYVQVESNLKMRFERAVRSGAIGLTEYGAILQSGYGEKPPESMREYMKKEYGFEG